MYSPRLCCRGLILDISARGPQLFFPPLTTTTTLATLLKILLTKAAASTYLLADDKVYKRHGWLQIAAKWYEHCPCRTEEIKSGSFPQTQCCEHITLYPHVLWHRFKCAPFFSSPFRGCSKRKKEIPIRLLFHKNYNFVELSRECFPERKNLNHFS